MFLEHQIKVWMITEKSRDTENSSNGYWKFWFAIMGINDILNYIKREDIFVIIFFNVIVFAVFLIK